MRYVAVYKYDELGRTEKDYVRYIFIKENTFGCKDWPKESLEDFIRKENFEFFEDGTLI